MKAHEDSKLIPWKLQISKSPSFPLPGISEQKMKLRISVDHDWISISHKHFSRSSLLSCALAEIIFLIITFLINFKIKKPYIWESFLPILKSTLLCNINLIYLEVVMKKHGSGVKKLCLMFWSLLKNPKPWKNIFLFISFYFF